MSKRTTWHQDIVDTLKGLGGSAPLAEIYDNLPLGRRRRKNWRSTVRNTLQTCNPSSPHYKGKALFKRRGRGKWALREQRAKKIEQAQQPA